MRTRMMHFAVDDDFCVYLAITWAFAWQVAGGQAAGVVAVLGAVFLGFVGYMYWHVEHQKKVFHGLKGVVERKA